MRISKEAVTTETWVETLAGNAGAGQRHRRRICDAKVVAIVRKNLELCREKKRRGESNTTITIPKSVCASA